jgi:hypothetical protein
VLAVPVPLVIPLSAQVPAARILMLALISSATMLAETTRGSVVALSILLFLQAGLAIGVLGVFAYVVSRLLARLAPGPRALMTLAVVIVLVAVTTAGSFYRDPFRPATLRANLIEVYE